MVIIMENILNDNIKECYLITGEIVVRYYELYELIQDNISNNLDLYEENISDILDLVIKEYDLYNNLSLTDINICLDLIKNIDCDKLMIDNRFKHKLEMFKKIKEGINISSVDLNLDIINKNMDFSLFEVLYSIIDIDVMKKLRYKIDDISTSNYNDLLFIKSLNKKFNLVLFNQTYNNNLSEIINLSYNMDCLKIPNINKENIFNIIKKILDIDNDNYFDPVDSTLMKLAMLSLDKLVEFNFENNPKIVFSNLLYITRLEIIISYMNKNSLYELMDYCELIKSRNIFGIDNVLSLIKNRLR